MCCAVNRPREFIDCVGHIRVLSWLLIGSLTHTAVTRAAAVTVCQPLSLEASSYISDHIMVIMTGFAEQSKVCKWLFRRVLVECCYL
jgi:protein unc-79